MRRRLRPQASLALAAPLLAGCAGVQSALDPAGRDAETIAQLFWVMVAGAVVLWLLVNGLAFFLTRMSTGAFSPRLGHALIIGGGVAFPTVVLAGLLFYGISIMPAMRAPGVGEPEMEVTAEQFWWRVGYRTPGGVIPSANEVVLPAGARTSLSLMSDQVIHSFWAPTIAGKLDMFPGRETVLTLEPLRPGLYRGQCAEFCGEGHAYMAFAVRVLEREDYAAWLAAQARPARPPEGALEEAGQAVFLSEGCGACHAVRGTPAAGTFGPDLTHVGGRATLGAGILPNEPDAMMRWIAHTEAVKPGVSMPSYAHLDEDALAALAAYLGSLE